MLEQRPIQAVKTPSFEMFITQIGLGAAWPKFVVGPDFGVGLALSSVLIPRGSFQHKVFKKSKIILRKK